MISASAGFLSRVLVGVTLLASISSCDDPLEPKANREIGVISYHGDSVVITVPDTVSIGEAFTVSVRTYGNGCVRQDDTEVELADLSLDITPYDVHSGARICTDELNLFDHTAALSIMQSGTAQIRFHGRQLPGDLPISEVREVVVK